MCEFCYAELYIIAEQIVEEFPGPKQLNSVFAQLQVLPNPGLNTSLCIWCIRHNYQSFGVSHTIINHNCLQILHNMYWLMLRPDQMWDALGQVF